ncbi:N-acyl-D-amino-acid deacylase family protein [Actinospongicola halichondriae]|uniref:N-acyl-D-amino-acid deacylase family protein n=1 Tax=Actinospongicola halichondriae TaxID=3236844 RepID=UPI003D57A372
MSAQRPAKGFDFIFRGATVVDGTGAPARLADVGVTDGRITAVGDIAADAEAGEIIDVTGRIVAPGIIDPHCHYDAQLLWDPLATPSNFHGVTTIVNGNCGFGLAPLTPGDGDYLRRMMARVEGMPLPALEHGVDWNWESFPQYLDRLDGNIGVNAAFMAGHCAIRRYVMGEDAVGSEATPEQTEEMAALLDGMLKAGALGFSTGRSGHQDGDGKPVASRWATDDEILALCDVVKANEGTTLEVIVEGCLDMFSDDEVAFLTDMSLRGGRPINWNVLSVDSADPERTWHQIQAGETAAERGGRIIALTMPILVPMNMNFHSFCALNMLPGWGDVLADSVADRMPRLRDPEVRRQMAADAADKTSGALRRIIDFPNYVIGDTYSDENEGLTGRRVHEIAAERGTDPFDTLIEIVLADDLRTVVWPSATDNDPDSWALRAEIWDNEHVMIGGSDAGAHLDRMCGAPYPTKWIGDCLRGRKLTTMERAIQMMTTEPAALFGITDRGQVAEGFHADLWVFDPEAIDATMVRLVDDLPGESSRLMCDAVGVDLVMVNGVPIVRDGETTGDVPGKVLRSGVDTTTVSVPGA